MKTKSVTNQHGKSQWPRTAIDHNALQVYNLL